MQFKAEIVEYKCVTELTIDQMKRVLDSDKEFDDLWRDTPDAEDINYDGHFGPFIFWTCRIENYKKATKQVSDALNRLLNPRAPKKGTPEWITFIADQVYSLPGRQEVFEQAYEAYPNWNDIQGANEASWWIRGELLDIAHNNGVVDIDALSEKVRDALMEEVGEMIYAALT